MDTKGPSTDPMAATKTGKVDPYDNEEYQDPRVRKLTERQRRFVEYYMATGNATEATRLAGYGGHKRSTWSTTGSKLLKHPAIRRAISARARFDVKTLTREERQAFWSATCLDKGAKLTDRLKASELLAKSQRDFVQQIEQTIVHKTDLQADLLGVFDKMQEKLQGKNQNAQIQNENFSARQLAMPEPQKVLANASRLAITAESSADQKEKTESANIPPANHVPDMGTSKGRPIPRIRRGAGHGARQDQRLSGVAKNGPRAQHDHVLVEVMPGLFLCQVEGCSYSEG